MTNKNRRNTIKRNESKKDTTKKIRSVTAKEKVKIFIKSIDTHNTFISLISLIVSIFIFFWTYSIQEKTFKFNTYNMDLSYKINISDKIDKENISVSQNTIYITEKEYIKITLKTGGISKFGLAFPQPYYENDFDIDIINAVGSDKAIFREAQDFCCILENFSLPISDKDDDKYYSSIIFIFEDYKHNFYSNLIVFEFDKKNLTNIDTRVYDKFHLLLTSNDIQSIPAFDFEQLKRYSNFRKKMNELNIEL